MSNIDDGINPAFPFVVPDKFLAYSGLTKREYAAIKIAVGVAAFGILNPEKCAGVSVDIADALLAALERKPE